MEKGGRRKDGRMKRGVWVGVGKFDGRARQGSLHTPKVGAGPRPFFALCSFAGSGRLERIGLPLSTVVAAVGTVQYSTVPCSLVRSNLRPSTVLTMVHETRVLPR